MRKWLAPVGIIIVIFLILASGYNGLVNASEIADSKWSQIDNQLQRRADLIPNLVSTVKGYAAHEEQIFTQVAEARAKLAGAQTPEQAAAANEAVQGSLARLIAIAENYPQLKADANFRNLQDELAGTENRIATARKDYNDAVQAYNYRVKRFPVVVYARMLGFGPKEYFQTAEDAKLAPQIDFAK